MKILKKIKKWMIAKPLARLVIRSNRNTLLTIANLKPDAVATLSKDQEILLQQLTKLTLPSRTVTIGGRIRFLAPEMEDVTLWDMMEARRADNAVDRVRMWCGGVYSPNNVYDTIKLSKFIEEELERSSELENALFPFNGGSDEGSKPNPIREAKNLLNMVQVTAELFHCSFEEAKAVNYTDAVLAISKRNDEIEKEKRKMKQLNNR